MVTVIYPISLVIESNVLLAPAHLFKKLEKKFKVSKKIPFFDETLDSMIAAAPEYHLKAA